MLTTDDLNSIREVLREEIITEQSALKDEVKVSQGQTQDNFKVINSQLRKIDSVLRKIQKDLKTTVDFLDGEYLKIEKRVRNIEESIHYPPVN